MSEANGRRVAIYARYSSDLQSDSSVEDQVRLCSELAKSNAWEVFDHYADAGLSGASLMRPGIQALITDALDGKFDVVLAEALDRISRDQEDIAGVLAHLVDGGDARMGDSCGGLGLTLEGQRDVILMLVEEHLSRYILEIIAKHGRFEEEPGSGVAFQIDIEDAAGLGSQIKTIEKEIEDQL